MYKIEHLDPSHRVQVMRKTFPSLSHLPQLNNHLPFQKGQRVQVKRVDCPDGWVIHQMRNDEQWHFHKGQLGLPLRLRLEVVLPQ